jgi:hypothetical protein
MIQPDQLKKESGFSLTIGPFLIHFTYGVGELGKQEEYILNHYANFLVAQPQAEQRTLAHSIKLYPDNPPSGALNARNVATLDNELRRWAARQARQSGGFMCHAAGVINQGVGWILAGPSGAGKTTLALKLAPHCQMVLSDEVCIVLPAEKGWKVWGTPFYGTGLQGITGPGSPLQAIFFPHHSHDLGAAVVPKSEALTLMLRTVVSPDKSNDVAVLDNAISLLASCRTYKTWFGDGSTSEEVYHAIIAALSS